MWRYKYNFIMIFIIIFSILFISSCNNDGGTPKNTSSVVTDDSSNYYYDYKGYKRAKEGIFSECFILNEENYLKYKFSLIGESGESGLLNKDIVDLKEDNLTFGKYYLVYVFYGNGNIDLGTNVEVSVVKENEVLFDGVDFNFGSVYCENYIINGRISTDVEAFFSMRDNPKNIMRISYNSRNIEFLYFSIGVSLEIKAKGIYDIDLSVFDTNSNYEMSKRFNFSVDENVDEYFGKIDNYKISFGSDSAFVDGNINDSMLTDEPNFAKNYSTLMVVDFDLTTLFSNDGNQLVNIILYSPLDSIIYSRLEDAPTAESSEKIDKDNKIIKLNIRIPKEKGDLKHCRIIYSFIPLSDEKDLGINLYINGQCISVNDYKNELINVELKPDILIYKNGVITGITDNSITTVNIPAIHDGMNVKIEEYAFKDCKELKYVNIEDGVKSIGKGAFKGCSSLKTLILPDTITYLDSSAFDECPEELFTKINDLYYIGNSSNRYLYCLKNINKDITSVIFNPNTKVICNNCFKDCNNLVSVNFMNIKIIGSNAFANCTAFVDLTIPKNVEIIGEGAFAGCTSLQKMELPFAGEKRYSLNGESVRTFAYLFNELVPENLTEVKITDCEYIQDFAFDGCTSLQKIELPSFLKSIGNRAFYYCTSLTDIKMPSDVNNIGYSAFENCTSLVDMVVALNIRTIESCAFANCTSLKNLYIPKDSKLSKEVTEIKSYAFANCTSLVQVELPKNVRKIEEGLFSNCSSLKSIILSGETTSIGYNAFSGCSALEEVYFRRNEDYWKKVTIAEGNDYLINAKFNYNY